MGLLLSDLWMTLEWTQSQAGGWLAELSAYGRLEVHGKEGEQRTSQSSQVTVSWWPRPGCAHLVVLV